VIDEVTLGELSRQLSTLTTNFNQHRIENAEQMRVLSNQFQVALAPISEIRVRMERAERDIAGVALKNESSLRELTEQVDAIDERVTEVRTQAAKLAGGISVLTLLASLIPWPWKH
jgi:predicted  nucleic acid-binding Zn-ribbon protein